jgi:phosphoenolpyruvate carboxykinase (ATP)
MALPVLGTAGCRSPTGIASHGLEFEGEEHWNLEWADLYERTIQRGEASLTADGVLLSVTGERTGRSPHDRYIIEEGDVTEDVWWSDVNVAMQRDTFNTLKRRISDYLNQRRELFIEDLAAGADPSLRMPIRLVSESPWHAAFARNMFLRLSKDEIAEHRPEFTILHAPYLKLRGSEDGVREGSEVTICISLAERLVIICGTEYAGEIKKSIFSIMNHRLPMRGHLPMHCSANVGEAGDAAVFFGLSGTGKTTLSVDPLRPLIGDDEHGWSEDGVFNFEGGCYAKMIRLSNEDEPEIFATSQMPGSILENVVLDGAGIPDFDDGSLTENTRGSYPIEFIENRVTSSMAGHPKNVVFLTCDAFGVLPPLSKLSPAQAAYHFISGYTAKIAGTEIGITEPQATFSACFGAPFMPMHPSVYADLLSEKVEEHEASCWLLNTGWIAGGAGASDRIKIKWTRALLNAALNGSLDDVELVMDERFGFGIPTAVSGVPADILLPQATWDDDAEYDVAANQLAEMFNENFEKYASGCSAEVCSAAPRRLI